MVNLFEQYTSLNNDFTKLKLLEFEDLRKKESVLKVYQTSLNELDREQFEVGFYRFKKQFDNMINKLSDFNPDNIKGELFKVDEYKMFIYKYRNDFLNISQKISFIHNKWIKFLIRNPELKNSYLDSYFNKQYQAVWHTIESSLISELSSAEYSISKFSEDIEGIISATEKISLYLNQYIFIGDEALELKNELTKYLNIGELSSKEEFISNLNKIFDKISALSKESTYGTVGLLVYKAYAPSAPSIFKFTVGIGDNKYLNYDSFFNNDGLKYENQHKYIYFENFPKSGIFRGREVCEHISYDKGFLKVISTIRNKFYFLLNISLYSSIFLAIFSILVSSLTMGIALVILFSILYIGLDYIFNFYTYKYSSSYRHLFYISEIDFHIIKFGNYINLEQMLNGMVENFDSVFTNRSEGKLWIKRYQLQKSL